MYPNGTVQVRAEADQLHQWMSFRSPDGQFVTVDGRDYTETARVMPQQAAKCVGLAAVRAGNRSREATRRAFEASSQHEHEFFPNAEAAGPLSRCRSRSEVGEVGVVVGRHPNDHAVEKG